MASFSDYLENELLDHVLGGGSSNWTPPATYYLALFSTDPTDAGSGNELSGNGYARQTIAFGTAASGGTKSSTTAQVFTAAGGNWLAAGFFAVFDASSGGNMLYHNSMTSKQIDDGDNITFAIGDINISHG